MDVFPQRRFMTKELRSSLLTWLVSNRNEVNSIFTSNCALLTPFTVISGPNDTKLPHPSMTDPNLGPTTF